MTLRDILVHIDHTQTCAARLDVALALAGEHGAHLTGLAVDPGPMTALVVEAPPSGELLADLERRREDQLERAKVTFERKTKGTDVASELRYDEGDAVRCVSLHARYADLVVIGQPEDRDEVRGDLLPDPLVVECGRPVLVVPYIGAESTPGHRVLVAWNDSRESARALNDALPVMRRAEAVRVIAVNPPPEAGVEMPFECADVCQHLARHGVQAEAQHVTSKDIDVGDMLLSRAADMSADLVVMGAYGHSRFRELVLGGVSRHLLRHMTVPVLLSH